MQTCRIDQYYEDFREFFPQARRVLERLRGLISGADLALLIKRMNPSMVEMTCQSVEWAKETVERSIIEAKSRGKADSDAPRQERSNPAAETIPESQELRKRHHGPSADMKRHHEIVEIIKRFGVDWQKHLEEIAGACEKDKIRPSRAWAVDHKLKTRSWSRAVEHYPDRVIKAIQYSLKMASR